MRLRYIAFKWYVDAPVEAVAPVLQLAGFGQGKQRNIWSRSVGEHKLEIEARERMNGRDRSYYWIRWTSVNGSVDKGALERILADWFFTINSHLPTTVNWMQVALDTHDFKPPLFGYCESSPRIWVKEGKRVRFSFFPVQDHYYFEVRTTDGRKAIPHNRFSLWLDELKHNLLGHQRPDDQITLDLNVG